MYIKNIISEIKKISGSKYIITEDWRKQPYSKGWRYGKGNAFAVVKPGTLIEIWKIRIVCERRHNNNNAGCKYRLNRRINPLR